jgi:hypothetical protein
MVLFLLPFCAVGVVTGVMAVVQLTRGDWVQAGFFAIFALAFGGAGFGLLAAAVKGHRQLKEGMALEAQRPGEPWMWKEDWAAGRVKSEGALAVWGLWFFTLVWNAISIPAGIAGVKAGLLGTDRAALLALLFPAIGTVLLVVALRQTLKHRKYGVSVFELAHVPGVIGRGLGGVLHTTVALHPADGFQIKLTCLNRVVTGSGKNRSVSERIQWEEKAVVTNAQQDGDRGGMLIPIAFRIPSDVPQTDESRADNKMIWRLEVTADVPGIDYHARFEVPVFKTELSTSAPDVSSSELVSASLDGFEQPADSRIRVTEQGRGLEIVFGRARNPGPAMGITVFTVIWTAVVVFLLGSDAPFFFPLIFGLVDLLIIYWTLWMWLGISVVTANGDRVTVARGLLFASGTRHHDARSMRGVHVKVGMQSGNTPFYRILFEDDRGKRIRAGWGIRDKREAEWLAQRLREATGIAVHDAPKVATRSLEGSSP